MSQTSQSPARDGARQQPQHVQGAANIATAAYAQATNHFAYVRDRELADLIASLDASIELIAVAAIFGEALSEREGKAICAALDKATDVLSELREVRS